MTRIRGLLLACVLACGGLVAVTTAPASADPAKSPELIPFVGSYAVSATWSAGGYHPYPAIDFVLPAGTPVYASGSGTVNYAIVDNRHCDPNDHGGGTAGVTWCQNNGYADSGTKVRIDHPDGRKSYYLHLSELRVQAGQKVTAGQLIALSGNTGISTGAHLHYQENDSSGQASDPGTLVGCNGSATIRYSDPQGLKGSVVSNGGYGCIARTASAPAALPVNQGAVPSLGATVIKHKDGRLQAFGVGSDRRIHTRIQQQPNGIWTNWTVWPTPGGLTLRQPIGVGVQKDGRVQLFLAGVDGQIRTRLQNRPGGGWGPWQIWSDYAGFPNLTPLTVAAQKDGRLMVLGVGRDGRVHARSQRSANGGWGRFSTWSGYAGFPATTPVTAAANRDGRLQFLAVGRDGRIHGRTQGRANGSFGRWTAWAGYRGFPAATPVSAALNKDGRMIALAVGRNGRVYTRTQRGAGKAFGSWAGWAGYTFPARTVITPAMQADGRLLVVGVGRGRVWTKAQARPNSRWGSWSAWGSYSGFQARTPVTVRLRTDGRLQAFAVGGGGRMYTRYQRAANKSFVPWAAWGTYNHFPTGAGR